MTFPMDLSDQRTQRPRPRLGLWRRSLGALAATAYLTMSLGAPAYAHDKLVDANPGDGDVVTQALSEIRLTYNANLLPTGAAMAVTGPNGDDVPLGDLVIDGTDVVVPFDGVGADSAGDGVAESAEQNTAGAPNGDYTLTWRVVSSDGHPITGAYTFTLALPDARGFAAKDAGSAQDADSVPSTNTPSTEITDDSAAKESTGQASTGDHATSDDEEEPTSDAVAIAIGVGIVALGLGAALAWHFLHRRSND